MYKELYIAIAQLEVAASNSKRACKKTYNKCYNVFTQHDDNDKEQALAEVLEALRIVKILEAKLEMVRKALEEVT